MRKFLFEQALRLGNSFSRDRFSRGFSLFLLIPMVLISLAVLAPSIGEKIFSATCHQNLNRSFTLAGIALPLCARCLGLYSGFGLAGLFLPIVSRRFSGRLFTSAVAFSFAFLFLRAFWPLFDTNAIRLTLGLLVGGGVSLFLKSRLMK